jgi:hypothetical protein
MENDGAYLQGTRDSKVSKVDHAYVIYELWRCNDNIRKLNDPPCATEEIIDNWLKGKKVGFRVINN